ncbi:restriction endonuclease subunit S [Jeotgalicoccus nanhaiensis]|uniref:Restriction endonuclease subunit S n=2 Tax=Jeotgalicoccus nanhaiensis TaxID=568603 RepID=A0ABR9XZJ5_9STAP|nr:restriction endonuclease subunit S [Jeotgalicoccus nanhaiensis]TFU61462.1 restriction endonuclease subunit S [Jeotgalicoccus nanhaiensis]
MLETLKKVYLSIIFPDRCETNPKMRFKNFNENWKEYKFFENINKIIDFRGRTPKKLEMKWSDKGYLALSALNVKNGFIDKNVDAKYGSEELYQRWMGGNYLKKGMVLFTTEAPMGNVALVPDNNGYILSQRTIAFDADKKMMTNLFLATILRTPLVINNLISISSGATAKGVSQKSLRALNLIVPTNLKEQERIGEFLTNIYDDIQIHQKQVNILNKLKSLYLHKMFL